MHTAHIALCARLRVRSIRIVSLTKLAAKWQYKKSKTCFTSSNQCRTNLPNTHTPNTVRRPMKIPQLRLQTPFWCDCMFQNDHMHAHSHNKPHTRLSCPLCAITCDTRVHTIQPSHSLQLTLTFGSVLGKTATIRRWWVGQINIFETNAHHTWH